MLKLGILQDNEGVTQAGLRLLKSKICVIKVGGSCGRQKNKTGQGLYDGDIRFFEVDIAMV